MDGCGKYHYQLSNEDAVREEVRVTEEDLIRRVVRETVHETLSGLGFDLGDIHEAQADLVYLRRVRKGSEEIPAKIKTSFITLIVPILLYLLWDAIKNKIKNG